MRLPRFGNAGAYFRDEQEIRSVWWLVEPGDVVIDVGAALGSYTFDAIAKGARVVVAVEPDLDALSQLVGLAGENDVLDRVVPVNEALYDDGPYPAELTAAIKDSPHAHLALADDTRFSTLDELAVLYGIDRLDWVKVDVEGAELGVLCGGRRTLEKHPGLLVEDHTAVYPHLNDGVQAAEMWELLTGFDYEIVKVPYTGPTRSYREMWVCR